MALIRYISTILVGILCSTTVFTYAARNNFVTPSKNITCPAHPCLTLNEYVREVDHYFIDNTTFNFLSGNHQLDNKLRLENVSNLVFTTIDVTQRDTVQIIFSPLVNITWSDCSSIEVSGLVFALSGQASTADSFFIALVFQRTTCFLSQLTLLGNRGWHSTAIATYSSQAEFSDVIILEAMSLYGAALFAFNSTIVFLGHNKFINNTAVQGGAIYLFECICNSYGNLTFINNFAISSILYSDYPLGGAICSDNSTLSFWDSSWFQHNIAAGSSYFFRTNFASGGAISLSNSTVTFHFSSETFFLDNTAIFVGGAMRLFSSVLVLQGEALFEKNIAGQGGGAINSLNHSRIYSRGRDNNSSIVFQNNYVTDRFGFSGAIFATSTNVELEEISFEGNVARDGGAVYCKKSKVHFSSCKFINNMARVTGGAVCFGTSTTATFDGVNNFSWNVALFGGAVNMYNASVTFRGENIFSNNNASLGSGCLDIVESNASIHGISMFYYNNGARGGGMHVLVSNVIIYGNSSFISNTAGIQGGAIEVENGTLNVTGRVALVKNQAFTYASILYARRSKITISGHTLISESDTLGDQLSLQYSAGLDGAFGVLQSRVYVTGELILAKNNGYEGAAINARDTDLDVKGCLQFFNNKAISSGGVVYARNSVITLRNANNCSNFHGNTARRGGAVYLIDSSIHLIGTQNFTQNSAQQGGAMALSSSSKLMLGEQLKVMFYKNQAATDGGAIYYADSVSITQCMEYLRLGQCLYEPSQCNVFSDEGECFIELTSHLSDIQLNFVNNSAGNAGTIFYGGRLDKCRLYVGEGVRDSCNDRTGGEYIHDAIKKIQAISNVISDDNLTSDISSDRLQVCICKDNKSFVCEDQRIETVRGKEFTLLAVIVGQNRGIVPSAVRTSLENNVQINATQRIQFTGKECTSITYRLFNKNSTTTLILFPDDGPCRDTTLSQRRIEISFLPCPNGFTLNGLECVCEERLQCYTSNCNVEDNSILRYSNSFWMGTVFNNDTFEGFILHPRCPFDYCIDNPVSITLENVDIQCNHNHAGNLCGSCKKNYSIAFGTLHCLPCSDNHLALIIPFALAGVVLVILLLSLQLSVATGMLNGLIFYANVIQANRAIFFPPGNTNILTVFIAWLNLDLGIETCFFDGMNIYAFAWLQFLFPFYVWFLIGLIIVVSRHSSKLSRSLGKNPIAALATLILLSYSKLLRTVIAVLSFTNLEYPDGNQKLVWIYDGNVPYFQRIDHIVLGVFAVFVLVFLFLPYTSLLLCGHWLQGYTTWWIFAWLNKIKPFMDAYHAPYKKESRYWTGFILLIRCILFLTFAFNTLGNAGVNLLAITSVTAGLAILAWLRNKVYEQIHNDILESAFILNLCIFAVATYHVNISGGNQALLSNISVGIAFVTFVSIVVYHIYLNLRKTPVWKKLPKANIAKLCKNVKICCKRKQHPSGQHNNRENLNVIVPTTITIDINEPLLEA